MEKLIKSVRVFMSLCAMLSVVSFASCSDDDDQPKGIAIDAVYGKYSGTMEIEGLKASALTVNATTGPAIEATVDKDKVSFADFPIKELVIGILGSEEAANGILQLVGKVSYDLAYTPTLNEQKDGIVLALNPQPLKLSIPLGADNVMVVNVMVNANGNGSYKNGELKLSIIAEKVSLGEGESAEEVNGFSPLTLTITMKQEK